MTPKDRAAQLVAHFYILPEEVPAVGDLYGKDCRAIAIHCAKVCCKQIIAALPALVAGDGYGSARFNNPDIEFYNNVLKEIDLL